MRPIAWSLLAPAAAILWGGLAAAQQGQQPDVPTIRIVGAGRQQVPIAIPEFDGGTDARGRDAARLLREVLRDDLLFSNYFSIVPDEYLKLVGPFNDRRGNYKEWEGIGADALLVGLARTEGTEGYMFEGKVYDTSEQRMVLGKRYRAEAEQLRLMAHRLADEIVQRYTGLMGIATTRITYVSQVGKGKEIFVMDYDGARPKRITATGVINRSPAWSPDGRSIAYLSYKGNQPRLVIQSSDGEVRPAFPQAGELNSAPAWSPDGRLLAFSSGRDGNAEIYTLRLSDGALTRLTRDPAIDTSPAWSPDGRSIAFTSDRAGSPQIYLMDAQGGSVRRLTSELSYCDAPTWSVAAPDEMIAFTARVPGGFDIYVYNLKTGTLSRLTEGTNINEWPRWSPDGRHLVFASNRTGSFDIYSMDADGAHVRRLTRGGNNECPSWSR
jgi:TolB protein